MKSPLELKTPYVIAEIGINHNGSAELALLMTNLCIAAGASAVKYQLFDPSELVSEDAEMANYQKQNAILQESQREMLMKHTISYDVLKQCRDICKRSNVDFICTAFDEPSLTKVISLEPDLLKWPSGEIDNLPLLAIAASSRIPIIISTGMSSDEDIEQAIAVCKKEGLSHHDLILLHCTSQYPTPDRLANVDSIRYLKDRYNMVVGFSDHTIGNLAAQLGLAAGATVFEKHISLSRLMNGVDHKASATVEELVDYIKSINHAADILGNYHKKCLDIEKETKDVARKSIFSRTLIPKGARVVAEQLKAMRPGTGISPKFTEELIGKTVNKDILPQTMLSWDDFL